MESRHDNLRRFGWAGGVMLWQKLSGAASRNTTGITFIASAKQINTASGSTLTLPIPAGTISGDLMIAVMDANNSGTSWTGDTGWTEVYDQGVNPRLRVAYKVAAAGDSIAAFTISSGSTAYCGGVILTYRNSSFDVIGSGFVTSGSTPIVAPGVNATGGLLLACYGQSGITTTSFSTPTGMSLVVDNTTGPNFAVFSENVQTGATGDRTSTPAGSIAPSAGILLAIKPI